MATVVHNQQPDIASFLHMLQMLQRNIQHKSYSENLTDMLKGIEQEKAEGITDVKNIREPEQANLEDYLTQNKGKDVTDYVQDIAPPRNATTRPYSQEDDERYRRQMMALNARYPRDIRVDPGKVLPPQDNSDGKFRGHKPTIKTVMDHKGHYGTFINGKLIKNKKYPYKTEQYTHKDFEMIGLKPITSNEMMLYLMQGKVPTRNEMSEPKKKKLTMEIGRQYMKKAKGNKRAARKMAEKDGYSWE